MKTWLKLITLAAVLALAVPPPAEAVPALTISTISVSTTTARSANLGAGLPHVVYCTVAVYFRYGDSTVTATTADVPLDAAATWTDKTTMGKTYVSFITASGSGSCYVKHDPT